LSARPASARIQAAGFELIIRRSFADYLLLWLQDAAIAFE
jgi:sarcosine oxidase gamma subunit